MKKKIKKLIKRHLTEDRVVSIYEKIGMTFMILGLVLAFFAEYQFKSIYGTISSLGWFAFWLTILWIGSKMVEEAMHYQENKIK